MFFLVGHLMHQPGFFSFPRVDIEETLELQSLDRTSCGWNIMNQLYPPQKGFQEVLGMRG